MEISPKKLILNLLRAAEDESISARSAIEACALFGIRENSVRVSLGRLVAEGLVEVVERGAYRLGPQAQQLAADVATWRSAEQRVLSWRGGWVAVYTGNLGRSDRSALRARERALALLGLRELERGLFVRPDNLKGGAAGVRERLGALGLSHDAAIFAIRDLDERRDTQARALWDGRALTRSYRSLRTRLEAWLARSVRLKHKVAARESFLLGDEAIRQIIFDPWLPEPLVDVQDRHALVETVFRFDLAGHAIWRRQLLLSSRPEAQINPPSTL